MANQTITQLPAAGPITGTELVPIVQNGQTVQTTTQAIAASPSQTQTFLTLNQEPTLPNSRRLAGGSGVGLTDNGAQSTLQIVLNGASGSLEGIGNGMVAKTNASTVAARTLTASGNGLGITNGDGVSGDPTFALTGVAAAVANLGGTGIMAIQSGTTVGGVQILGTANQIAVANGNGAGNPTIAIADDAVLPGTGAVTIPRGTTLQQPSGTDGQLRYNTSSSRFEGYSGSWQNLGSGDGSVTQITAGTGLTGGTITTTGTIAIANTGVSAGAYGSASKTLLTTVNAQGQLTNLSETDIAIANTQVSGLGTASTLNAGVANGVATLDAGGTVPLSQIPASLQGGVSYQGTWNATTNTPTLTSGVGTKGYYYVVDVAGSTDLDGITNWNVGDWAIFNGTIWQKIDNTDAVTSVNGYTGTVVLTASDIGGLGTMATQDADAVAITGGSMDGTTIGSTTPAAATFTTLTATGQTDVGGSSALTMRFTQATSTVMRAAAVGASVAEIRWSVPSFHTFYTGSNATLSSEGAAQFRVNHTASAVNYVQVTGAATGGTPVISSQGSDANAGLNLVSKGNLGISLRTRGGGTERTGFVVVDGGASSVNYLQAQSNLTGFAPTFSVQGSDTNISQVFQSKGAGAIDLAAGSSGVNISNGGTVTAVTGTAGGSYTTVPTVTISAPTTAGGVQATATAAMAALTLSVTSGGTGYAVGDTITLTGGTFSQAIVLTVATLSGSAVATVTTTNAGTYTALPTNPISQGSTSGAGTGATFTVSAWQVRTTAFTITNAGSGYVEQPTVSFSSGSAAAYATVGGTPVIKGLGSNLDFYTANTGIAMRLEDTGGGVATGYLRVRATTGAAQLLSTSSMSISSSGSNNISFLTNGISQEQFRITHTASAVNYVQVTGAATGSAPTVSAQGSDSGINLNYASKGTYSSHIFTGTQGNQFQITGPADGSNSSNRFIAYGGKTGTGLVLGSVGTDTNISQVFQSKGTGAIDLAAGSSGVNISNGGTVTAITVTASGSNYTSIPSCVITAPTTAGGVQATATPVMFSGAATIAGGGTGYAVNDVLTVTGGTYTAQATYTVTAVSGGVITSVSRTTGAGYSVLPANPVSVTGGTGTGATLNLTWTVGTPTITNAGSGYVEQPTVSFSGGGGSGAAAYAQVGATTIIKGLGPALDFYTPNTSSSPAFRVTDYSGSAATGYWSAYGGNASPILRAVGATSGSIQTGSAVPIQFITNATTAGAEQFRVAHTASAVNYVQVTGAATSGTPVISAQGSDTNISLQLNAKGSGGVRTQFFHQIGTGYANYISISGNVTTVAPTITAAGSDTNIDLALATKGTGSVVFNANSIQRATIRGSDGYALLGQNASGTQSLSVAPNGSAVNYVQVISGLTGAAPIISSLGSDTNIDLTLTPKGTGGVVLGNNQANYADISGGATTNAVEFNTLGSDANVALALRSKGTGAIDLAAGSSGVNISNGGTVTAITVTASGSGYTTIPSLAISAPTTAGGVQATASPLMFSGAATVASGGTGYTVGDVLLVTGGTYSSQASYTVATVSAGVVTSVTRTTGSGYSVLPTNPASTTGGTGTGCTLNATWTIGGGAPTITNAGSGYVEQPTVTFSGGGGSGAAAYAVVGGGAVLKALNTFNIGTNSGTHLQLLDGGLTNVNFLRVQGGASVYVGAAGSDTNVQSIFYSRGTGNVTFATGSGSTYQLNVAHTASAVNYVQVTGAATGSNPIISTQGSDTNAGLTLQSKGTFGFTFRNSSNGTVATITHAGSSTPNYVQLGANISGQSPYFASAGADTNIDITLIPKGTGNVRFGTYTGTPLAIAGYIEIKDAGGTIRKLAVVA